MDSATASEATTTEIGPFEFDQSSCRVVAAIDADSARLQRGHLLDSVRDFEALAILWDLPMIGWSEVSTSTARDLRTLVEQYPFAAECGATERSWRRLYQPVVTTHTIFAQPDPLRTARDVRSAKRLTRFGNVRANASPGMRTFTQAEAAYWGITLTNGETPYAARPKQEAFVTRPNVWHWLFAEVVLDEWLKDTSPMQVPAG